MKTDRITVYKSKSSGSNHFHTSIEFFENEYTRHFYENKIVFKIVSLDWAGKIFKCKKLSENVFEGSLPKGVVPGDYYVNWEESSEDKLVFDL